MSRGAWPPAASSRIPPPSAGKNPTVMSASLPRDHSESGAFIGPAQSGLALPAAQALVERQRDTADDVDHARPRRVEDDRHHWALGLEAARGELGQELPARVLDLVIGIGVRESPASRSARRQRVSLF